VKIALSEETGERKNHWGRQHPQGKNTAREKQKTNDSKERTQHLPVKVPVMVQQRLLQGRKTMTQKSKKTGELGTGAAIQIAPSV
jgi:hypothetical protein